MSSIFNLTSSKVFSFFNVFKSISSKVSIFKSSVKSFISSKDSTFSDVGSISTSSGFGYSGSTSSSWVDTELFVFSKELEISFFSIVIGRIFGFGLFFIKH